ncbi:MAG: response regulator [Planctomycetota bacterium]
MSQQPLHVLLIEDDDAHAMIVKKGFQSAGARGTIERVRDGAEGVAYVKREGVYADRPRPQLILLDLNLPKLDGLAVLRILKGDDHFNTIPVVVLTTSDADNDLQQAYSLHANSYLVKPVNFAQFRDLIGAVISYWGEWNRAPVEAGI